MTTPDSLSSEQFLVNFLGEFIFVSFKIFCSYNVQETV